MSKRSDRELLADMLECAGRVQGYIKGMAMETYLLDQRTIDAVVRNLEIIGEASNRLSDGARALAPEIEWFKIIGLRHRIVHDYFNIDEEIVWEIANTELEALKLELSALLSRLPN